MENLDMLTSESGDFVVFVTGDDEVGYNVYQGMVKGHGENLDVGTTIETILFKEGVAIYDGNNLLGVRYISQSFWFESGDVEEYIHWEESTEELEESGSCFTVYVKDVADLATLETLLSDYVQQNKEDNELTMDF